MSKASRIARPPVAGGASRLPSTRRDIAVGRCPRTLVAGEKLMRTESEGSLRPPAAPRSNGAAQTAQTHTPANTQDGTQSRIRMSTDPQGPQHKPGKGNLKITSPEDSEQLSVRKGASANATGSRPEAKGNRGVSRRHTVGGARGSREILAMQPSEMDKKREAFLEHLKQKYPHHASAIMGHQERLRDQNRRGAQSPTQLSVCGEQVEQLSLGSLDALEVMSEYDALTSPFTRGSRSRASLPVVRSANQTKDRSLGVLLLQYGDDIKQIRMPNEITGLDTVKALFVSAFPQQLSMKMLESPGMAIYIRDDMRNIYYELTDVRNITDHSCLKVYNKDPAHAFRPNNGDIRIHRELMYSGRDGPHPLRQPTVAAHPPHMMQIPISPPTPHHNMPASPSRIPFAGLRPGSALGNSTMPRERMSHTVSAPVATAVRSASPCPSAILERRDVKPDEDLVSKGGPAMREGLYAEPHHLIHHGPPPTPDQLDHVFHTHHSGTLRSYNTEPVAVDHPSLYRQKSRKYTDSQLPTLGSKTPPSSPHRMVPTEIRMIDPHPTQSQSPIVLMDRASPIRQSLRKEGAAIGMETMAKTRSSVPSPAISDFQGHAGHDPEARERMTVMEKQIASLTGLVQHALLKGSNSNGTKESSSDRQMKNGSPVHSSNSAGASSDFPLNGSPASTTPVSSGPRQVNLVYFQKNISDLRLQLQQMRQLQLQNQECMHEQLKRAEQEITARLKELLKQPEEPLQRQRELVDEDRHKYLTMEERVLTQLGDLECYVENLRSAGQRSVGLKEVEDGAVSLRKVGEGLAGLKAEFPSLQGRMRAVLRVEVEAVKFLKEEPHKLDSMLKRVKMLTDTLSTLRRCATDGLQKPLEPVTVWNKDCSAPPKELQDPSSFAAPIVTDPQGSSVRSEVVNLTNMVIHRAQSSPVPTQQSQHSAVPNTVALPQDSNLDPIPSKNHPPQTGSPVKRKKATPSNLEPMPLQSHSTASNRIPSKGATNPSLFIEEIQSSQGIIKSRALSIEAAEKEWEEKRLNMAQYDGKEFEKILQQAEANILRGISNLVVTSGVDGSLAPPAVPENVTEKPDTAVVSIAKENPLSDLSTEKTEKLSRPATAEVEKSATPSLEKKNRVSTQDGTPKLIMEKISKSPPPPPPRKNSSSSTGLTTTRSGEVVFTGRKDSVSTQEGEDTPASPQTKTETPPEVKNKPSTPPPSKVASPITEEEDEGEKIMAELQVFQKCPNQGTGLKGAVEHTRVEPQVREIRPGVIPPLREKKQNSEHREDQNTDIDENGNNTRHQSPGVIYYVTGQISKDTTGLEEPIEFRGQSLCPPTQVSHVNASDQSQRHQQVVTDGHTSIPDSNGLVRPQGPSMRPQKSLSLLVSQKASFTSPMEEPTSPTQGTLHTVKAAPLQVSIEEKVEVPLVRHVSASSPVEEVLLIHSEENSGFKSAGELQVQVRKYDKEEECDEGAGLSPDLPGEEAPPPPDNIAFMITNSKVQPLSTGEYQNLVNAKKGNVQTVTVGKRDSTASVSTADTERNNNKKPVIIIFDEPMDIRSAYKRLSTIFECEEDLERMLSEERIEEESEEYEEEEENCEGLQVKHRPPWGKVYDGKCPEGVISSSVSEDQNCNMRKSSSSSCSSLSEGSVDAKQDFKKKFKFKFPKKQLAALTQALRSGNKSGKKTLQVVVYEDEEEYDGTIRQQKEAKRFEIVRSAPSAPTSSENLKPSSASSADPYCRTDEIRKSTYKTLDSLEQTIKQLETTINEMGPQASEEKSKPPELPKSEGFQTTEMTEQSKPPPTSLSKILGHRSQPSKGPNLKKKPKPQLLPRPATIPSAGVSVTPVPTQKNPTAVSPTSRMPVPASVKARQQTGASDRTSKQQKLQDSQRQLRQANGSAKRSAGDHKTTSPPVSASKIPAFSSSSGKGLSQSAPNSDATNSINSSLHPLSSSSSLPPPHKSSIPSPRPAPNSSSHIPSLSNGALKLAPPTHNTKGLSFSTQTQNGRPSFSSSSNSPSSSSHSSLSPTLLGQGMKSIRTIHTPSFTTSYNRTQNGNSSKSAIPTITSVKDTA
ncbi:sickle tail protein homolog isoform X4 [Denticeps clupeoides]|uniref:sickle tail protein homolog isoform X4 n=1 Tax=Denticeps clupeoides TaxID=299321 RepID=UPI0010A56694|nr:sickle tail protein homolog isoform X4 [Denticeps clupeoides]